MQNIVIWSILFYILYIFIWKRRYSFTNRIELDDEVLAKVTGVEYTGENMMEITFLILIAVQPYADLLYKYIDDSYVDDKLLELGRGNYDPNSEFPGSPINANNPIIIELKEYLKNKS